MRRDVALPEAGFGECGGGVSQHASTTVEAAVHGAGDAVVDRFWRGAKEAHGAKAAAGYGLVNPFHAGDHVVRQHEGELGEPGQHLGAGYLAWRLGGDGWESNPPRTPHQRPADGFED